MPWAVNFWKKINRSQGKSFLLCNHLLKCPRSISHYISHLFKSTLVFSNVCHIHCVCANNHLQLKSSQLGAVGSTENAHYTFLLWSKETLLFYFFSLNFRLLNLKNIKFQSQAVLCTYLHMHTFLRLSIQELYFKFFICLALSSFPKFCTYFVVWKVTKLHNKWKQLIRMRGVFPHRT